LDSAGDRLGRDTTAEGAGQAAEGETPEALSRTGLLVLRLFRQERGDLGVAGELGTLTIERIGGSAIAEMRDP
jgi:hypothetical protein